MDTVSLLANERRARLAAERLLEMRQRELKLANKKLSDHARTLSAQIMAKRQEMEDIHAQTESLRDEYTQTQGDLARAHSAAELAERRLWSALQSVRDGFAVFDAEHKLVVANKAYLAVFDELECVRPGITYPEIVKIMVEEGIIDPQGPPGTWVDKMIARWHDDAPESVILRLWNGQFVKVMDNRTPEGGTVTLGINQTDQLRMWAAVETIADGFVLFDQEDRLVMCNAQFRDMYDLPVDEAPNGSTFESILRITVANGRVADAIGREDQWLEERLSEHRRPSGSIEQQLSDGRWLRIVERATPDGGRVGLRVDITEIKRQQAALEAERERAEAANRAKSAFLANMSHEIRTPMNGVVGMADLLKGSALTSEQELYVDTIKSSGQALLTVLNDILDFPKIEANKAELTIAPFNLEDCLHDVVRLLKPMIATLPIRLDIAFDPAQPNIVSGDASRVRQILMNIIGNALKFTHKGSVAVRVAPQDGGVRIEVEDTGIGIPKSKLEHIFGEFNQVEDDRNRSYDGTGLGLAICRQLADQMGGAISVKSTLGQGSCFIIDLPLTAALDQSGAAKLAPGMAHAIILGAKSEAREGLVTQLAHLGIKARVARKPPKNMETDCLVFLMSEAADPTPPVFVVAPLACVLVGGSAPSADAKWVDAHISQPVSRSALVQTLNTLQKTKGPKVDAPPNQRQLHVLAAEDNKTNQLVLRKMLKTADIHLQVVSDGAQAVAAFTEGHPDLIFMDISMPGMDGREAARQIRALEAEHDLGRTPIVAMTAHDMDSDKEEIAAAGIDHHLSKPLNRDALLAHIETVRATRQEVG